MDPARHRLMFGWTEVASIAFWDAYLKDDKAARDYLASDALPTLSKGELTLERK